MLWRYSEKRSIKYRAPSPHIGSHLWGVEKCCKMDISARKEGKLKREKGKYRLGGERAYAKRNARRKKKRENETKRVGKSLGGLRKTRGRRSKRGDETAKDHSGFIRSD